MILDSTITKPIGHDVQTILRLARSSGQERQTGQDDNFGPYKEEDAGQFEHPIGWIVSHTDKVLDVYLLIGPVLV